MQYLSEITNCIFCEHELKNLGSRIFCDNFNCKYKFIIVPNDHIYISSLKTNCYIYYRFYIDKSFIEFSIGEDLYFDYLLNVNELKEYYYKLERNLIFT